LGRIVDWVGYESSTVRRTVHQSDGINPTVLVAGEAEEVISDTARSMI
jgi:hypothetical protein